MSVTVDANVLVYASNDSDPAHERAAALIDRLAAGPDLVYLFWPTLLGYLRLVTHPSILPQPLAADVAMGNVDALLRLPHVRTGSETEAFWPLFRTGPGAGQRGNAVPDAHLVALMRQHGVATIYTRDRDFRRFDGVRAEDPFA